MEEYKELDDPVEEVYRIYHAHLREERPKWEAMGFKFVSEVEAAAMRNR